MFESATFTRLVFHQIFFKYLVLKKPPNYKSAF